MATENTIQPGWFSIKGAVVYTGLCESSLRRAMEAGKFSGRRVSIGGNGSKAVRIKREDLDAWIEGRKVNAEN